MMYYDILNIPPRSSFKIVEQSYNRIATSRKSNDIDKNDDYYNKTKEAYEFLADKYRKKYYDTYNDQELTYLPGGYDTFIYMRMFTSSFLYLFFSAVFLLYVAIIFLPLSLLLIKNEIFFTKIWQTSLIFFGSFFFAILYLGFSIFKIKNNAQINTKPLIKSLYLYFAKIICIYGQTLLVILIIDDIINIPKVFWIFPYVVFEILHTIHRRRITIETRGRKNRENLASIIFLELFSRISCMFICLLPLPLSNKTFILVYIVVLELMIYKINWKYILFFTVLVLCYVSGLYEGLCLSVSSLRMLFCSFFYIILVAYLIFFSATILKHFLNKV
ncbi:hypothetical protein COBT_000384 [Conglomerata obtusa]